TVADARTCARAAEYLHATLLTTRLAAGTRGADCWASQRTMHRPRGRLQVRYHRGAQPTIPLTTRAARMVHCSVVALSPRTSGTRARAGGGRDGTGRDGGGHLVRPARAATTIRAAVRTPTRDTAAAAGAATAAERAVPGASGRVRIETIIQHQLDNQ